MRVGGSSVPGNMLIVYGSKECQEFMLPGPEMMDHKVQLKREVLGTDRSLTVLLKSDGFRWSLAKGREYAFIRQEGGEEAEVLLEDRLLLRLKSTEGGQAFLLSVVCKEIYPALKKYSLSDINRIQIGADEGCVINYHFEDYISGKHAQIYRRQDQWKICDSSRNGSWLNGTKIMEEKSLKFGDQITIFGLQIIWLGKCFALGVRFGECRTEEKVLRPLLCERTAEKQHGEASLENGPEKMYLKRAPRSDAACGSNPKKAGIFDGGAKSDHDPSAAVRIFPDRRRIRLSVLSGCRHPDCGCFGADRRFMGGRRGEVCREAGKGGKEDTRAKI